MLCHQENKHVWKQFCEELKVIVIIFKNMFLYRYMFLLFFIKVSL